MSAMVVNIQYILKSVWIFQKHEKADKIGTKLVTEAEVQKYMFTYHYLSRGNLILCLYCTFRSNKYNS